MKTRIMYLDYLKAISIFFIIIMHVTIFWSNAKILNISMHNISQIERFAVPIFLMVSGALLLNKNIPNFKTFFTKKTYKLALPYIFYVIILILITCYLNKIYTFDYHLLEIISFNFFTPNILWYFWMIIGVYLAIPIINEFVINRKIEGIRYFLIIAIIASIIYQICKITNHYTYLDLRFFIGPIFYILLGYYLHNKKFKISNNKIILISLILFIISSFFKIGFNIISPDISFFYGVNNFHWITGENIFLETFLDIGLVEIIHASSIFLLIKYLIKRTLTIDKLITSIGRSTWGIFCCHVLFLIIISIFITNLKISGNQSLFLIILISIAILFVTHMITLILSKIPILKKFSGYY